MAMPVFPINARDPKSLNSLGTALKAKGRLDDAANCYGAAIFLDPANADAHFNLGNLRHAQNNHAAAVRCFEESITLSPLQADAHNNLGASLLELKETHRAIHAFLRALELDPEYAEAYFNLGNAMAQVADHANAVGCFEEAVRLRPGYAKAWQNRGAACEALGDLDAAIACYRKGLEAEPDCPRIAANLASALAIQGHAGVIDVLQEMVDEDPASAAAHWNLAIALLLHGRLEQGWQEFEWRWKWDGFPSPARDFRQPQWHGEALAGATILLHAEQGLGDTLQFVRYAPLVAARGGTVVLEVQPGLRRLLSPIPGVFRCIAQGDPLPAFDCHCPLMSLPLALGDLNASAAVPMPYIRLNELPRSGTSVRAESVRAETVRAGLVWAGSPENQRDRLRSIPLAHWLPLFQLPGLSFVSLQKNPVGTLPDTMEQQQIATALDFADTAAIVASLDLVVTVDTAIAHLAGAMGKPVWILLSTMPDWRWGLRDETSRWYPSARLLRSRGVNGWDELMARVAVDLRAFVQQEGTRWDDGEQPLLKGQEINTSRAATGV